MECDSSGVSGVIARRERNGQGKRSPFNEAHANTSPAGVLVLGDTGLRVRIGVTVSNTEWTWPRIRVGVRADVSVGDPMRILFSLERLADPFRVLLPGVPHSRFMIRDIAQLWRPKRRRSQPSTSPKSCSLGHNMFICPRVADIQPFVAGTGRGDPTDVTAPYVSPFDRLSHEPPENKHLEEVMLRIRHSGLQTTDQVYKHLRR